MWWNDYWPMPFMYFGPLMMVAFIVLCFAMMWFMMGGARRHRAGGGYPLEILKERLARGDINQAEYEERRRILEA